MNYYERALKLQDSLAYDYQQGINISQLSKKYNLNRIYIYYALDPLFANQTLNRHNQPLTSTQKQDIIELYQQKGLSIASISKIVHATEYKVRKHLHKYAESHSNITILPYKQKVNKEIADKMRQDNRDGLSIKAIAEKYQLSRHTVYLYVSGEYCNKFK